MSSRASEARRGICGAVIDALMRMSTDPSARAQEALGRDDKVRVVTPLGRDDIEFWDRHKKRFTSRSHIFRMRKNTGFFYIICYYVIETVSMYI